MPEAVFMMGLPAAGKSTYVAQHAMEFSHHVVIDPDAFAVRHPAYSPEDPAPAHEATKVEVRAAFKAAVAAGKDFVLDSTSWNAERLFERISEVRAVGYKVVLVYVRVPLEVALARNAARPRHVPVEKVAEIARVLESTFAAIQFVVDEVRAVDNARPEAVTVVTL